MDEPVSCDDIPLQMFRKNSGTSAISFRFGKHHVLIYRNIITDKKLVARYVADYGIERPAPSHELKALGFRITVDDEEVKLFRYSKKPIKEGREQWALSLRRNSIQAPIVCGVSLQVFESDPPNRVDFNTQSAIDAAMAVYRSQVDKAEFELRKELLRISTIASREHRNPTNTYEPPINPNIPDSPVAPSPVKKSREEPLYKADKKLVVFRRKP